DGAPVVTAVEHAQPDRAAGDGLVLGLERVSVHFGGIAALTDVDLAVDAGEVCGLIGPNGAGKTTLFDVVSGVRIPETGRVMLDGTDITRWPASLPARCRWGSPGWWSWRGRSWIRRGCCSSTNRRQGWATATWSGWGSGFGRFKPRNRARCCSSSTT